MSPVGISESPRMNMSAAPNDAPDATPVVYGSARGLRMSDCITAPPTANPAPQTTPMMARGTLYSHTTSSAILSSTTVPWRCAERTLHTTSGVMEFSWERKIEANATHAATAMANPAMATFRLLTFLHLSSSGERFSSIGTPLRSSSSCSI